ncbi:MAG: hypothetical protein GXY48_00770 [Methanomicrobiales archaeon]|nr:hypothetical protein [Methanomicrobiales archaeon]
MYDNNLLFCIPVIISLIFITLFTGCVEVTPPSGEIKTDSFGIGTDGDIKDVVDGQDSSATQRVNESSKDQIIHDALDPAVVVPPTPNESFVQVTPMDYEKLQPEMTVSYLPYNRPVSTTERQYVIIHNITKQNFSKNATAYAYELTTPPLYIELGFYPRMVTDEQEVYKRTGDKEGTVKYTKVRPSQDAWFEMRIYDLDTKQEIIREGYGKIYSLTNKTVAIRRAGKFQFDFMGDAISADIKIKIPVDASSLSMYSEVSDLIEDQKKKSALIPDVFLTKQDLGSGWERIGDLIHTPGRYSSIYHIPSSGTKISQDISRFSTVQEAGDAYLQTKKTNAGESQITLIAGDEGYGFESIRKTGVIFKQGSYLIQLSSYSVPPVPFNDLKRYAGIVSGRISHI